MKLPMLLRPMATAAAIGFAVSVAQYLPTLFIGAGRVATLTTEAVTLSSGADRRSSKATPSAPATASTASRPARHASFAASRSRPVLRTTAAAPSTGAVACSRSNNAAQRL